MNTKQIITNALEKVINTADVRAGRVYKGWIRGSYGWYYEPFNGNPVHLGKNKSEALQTIEYMEE